MHRDQVDVALLVQRPHDDEDLPCAWGLPAATLAAGESWEDAARRAGAEKLGVTLDVGVMLEQGQLQRERYVLDMRLFQATIARGEPHVPQLRRDVTQYAAWRWAPLSELQPASERGSLCAQLGLAWLRRSTHVEG
jgi:ADP-ribose pyrophosphatase YjhB (NUDIX family)